MGRFLSAAVGFQAVPFGCWAILVRRVLLHGTSVRAAFPLAEEAGS